MSQISYLREFSAQVSEIVSASSGAQLVSASSVHKYHRYLLKFCEQVSQIVSSADLTILRLITTVWAKMSQNSYLREFCEQVSEFLFLALLTFLRLITTVSAKMSQDS